jgi:hypothetical protein
MLHTKRREESSSATAASVRKEMLKPRMSRSARIPGLKLDSARIVEQPSAVISGIVDRLVPSSRPSQPEKAQIAVEGADLGYRDLRIENSLIDEYGDEVSLKKGAHVEITITAKDVNHD